VSIPYTGVFIAYTRVSIAYPCLSAAFTQQDVSIACPRVPGGYSSLSIAIT